MGRDVTSHGAPTVLTGCLVETFGFRHLLWVYSGRRGIHCWISDAAALDLNDDQRKSLVTFLEVVKGSSQQAKKVNVRGGRDDAELHPVLKWVPASVERVLSSRSLGTTLIEPGRASMCSSRSLSESA
jgi:DNA primase catalytic subunit